jgi:hypothetical protein
MGHDPEVKDRDRFGGLAEQAHPDLMERLVPLPQVAGAAGAHDVLPDGSAAQRFGDHMVNGHPFPAVSTAILAGIGIPLLDILLVEGDCGGRRALHIPVETDHGWDDKNDRRRPNDSGAVLHPLGSSGKQEDHCPSSGTDM